MNSKSLWQSKTFWFNCVSALLMLAQWAAGQDLINPDVAAIAIAVLNIALRIITRKPVHVE
jgi:hypothetical protein